MKPIILFFILFAYANISHSAICISQGNGAWETAGTWLCDGIAAVPSCGDTIYIKSGHTVQVTTNNSTLDGCGDPSFIVIENGGTLDFGNGDKLALDCGSGITVESGGTISASGTGGGASNNITICGSVVWKKSDGDVTTPTTFGEPLPVELLHFIAELNRSSVEISWATLSETDNDYFIVERSEDFLTWKEIARVEGQVNSSIQVNYAIEDDLNKTGIYYYRLSQFDLDGYSEMFDFRVVEYNALLSIEPYPNPSNGLFTIGNLDFEESYTFSVFDIRGQRLKTLVMEAGHSSIDLTEFNSGQYLIELSNKQNSITKQIIIQ